MNTVKIGSQERSLNDADPHWVEQQINGLRRDREVVVIVVRIRVGGDDLCFVAPPPPGSGPRRQYSTTENAIIALWGKCGMNKASVSAGDLISFLKQLPHYLS